MFHNSEHKNNVEKHLKTEGGVVVLLLQTGQHAYVASDFKVDGTYVKFSDVDGDFSAISYGCIFGYTLATRQPAPEEPSEEAQAEMEAAFTNLRAACEASKDPDVMTALAALVAIEEAAHDGQ